MEKPLNIIFAGTPEFAVPSLQALLSSEHEVVAVYTQPDRPAGRGRKLTASPVKQQALAAQLPIEQPPSLKIESSQRTLRSYAADLMVVVAYGLLLPESVLAIPRLGCINVHASVLPRWRGAAPIQRAILAGDAFTGVTIMQMDKGLDTGAMLSTHQYPLTLQHTAQQVHDDLSRLGARALIPVVQALRSGSVQPQAQDDGLACYAAKLNKQEAKIDWRKPALEIHNQIRAFNPWPIAFCQYQGVHLRLWASEYLADQTNAGRQPGAVVAVSKRGIEVACGEGRIRITQLQLPGGKVLAANEFVNAHSMLDEVLT